MKPSFLIRLVWIILAALGSATASANQPPDAQDILVVTLPEQDDSQSARQSFSVTLPEVELSGSVEVNAPADSIRFRGTYATRQDVDPETSLAFQVFDSKGNLALLDGRRTSWEQTGEELRTTFDYSYGFSELGLNSDQTTATIAFNYVKEGEYWYDLKHPDARLPALTFTNINRGERFKPIISWMPRLAPAGSPVWSFHIFKSVREDAYEAFNYSASLEAHYLEPEARDDNKRYALFAEQPESLHFLAARAKFPETGAIKQRLGFVWEGQRWYEWGTPDHYQTSYVLPVWGYLGVALLALAVAVFAFRAAVRVRARKLRLLAISGASLLILVVGMEFCSAVMPSLLLMAAATVVVRRVPSTRMRMYWILFFFVLCQEFLWSLNFPVNGVKAHGIFFSLFLYALLFAPVTLLRSARALRAVGIPALALLFVYYLTMRVYVTFFDDYPALNILTYAGQGASLADSVVDLLGTQHLIAFMIFLWAVALACLNSKSPRSLDASSAPVIRPAVS